MDPTLLAVLISTAVQVAGFVAYYLVTGRAAPALLPGADAVDRFKLLPGLPGHPFLNGLAAKLPLIERLIADAAKTPTTVASAKEASPYDQTALTLLATLAKDSPAFMAALANHDGK